MKIILLVIDGFGVGESPDASEFNDVGSNTYKNIVAQTHLALPTLEKLGLDLIDGLNLNKPHEIMGAYARLQEKSVNKDSLTGHWEMMGIVTTKKYQSFPNEIDANVVKKVQEAIGETLFNRAGSGTDLIKQLGHEHILTKKPILYSSQDSVLQIACHDSVYKLDSLYEMCQKVKAVCDKNFEIQRIIARPFSTNEKGEFYRTNDRKDFSILPPSDSALNYLQKNGILTIGVGKIGDIFSNLGLSESYGAHTNLAVFEKTFELIKSVEKNAFIFVNLVDTDMLYGHRNDVIGYANCLKAIDGNVKNMISKLDDDDILMISGDHGNDPTTKSTDHSREWVPLLIYGKTIKPHNLGSIYGFDYIGNFIKSKLLNDKN